MKKLISVVAFSLLMPVSLMTASAEPPNNPAPAVNLSDFGRYQSKPLVRGTDVEESDLSTTNITTVIEHLIEGKTTRWNADGILRGKRTLIIQPEIIELRLGNKTIVRNSKFKLRLNLTDANSNEVIGQPEFTEKSGAMASFFTKGRSDEGMYNEVVKAASAYLDSNYQTAVDAALRAREESIARYKAAAEQGDAAAQFTLGSMYSAGREIAKDEKEAARWWLKAAEQGNEHAQVQIGWAYANGKGLEQDDGAAIKWWRAAADQGNAQAQLKLGWMYENGRGVARNESEAFAWYRKAAHQGDETAKKYVARKERSTTRYSSFDEAYTELAPEDGLDVQLITDPLSLKGRILTIRLTVVQVLSKGQLLVTNPYLGASQLDGRIYYAQISAAYAGRREFVDGQQVAVVGEVTGLFQYTTTLGAPKTVPKIVVYGIRSGY